ncbi:hypothetical protein [Serratia aquatilis]|uniref:Fimbrial-type adhesion domain-containing protein n=1 Tax=Serratia aquatilis TaxID=1737515 RepID=A0ABV6EFK6_9GAMM
MAAFDYKVFDTPYRWRKTDHWVNDLRYEQAGRGKKMGRRLILSLPLFLLFAVNQAAHANLPNTYWADPGTNNFIVELAQLSFPSNRAGATLEVPYVTPGVSDYLLNSNNQTGQTTVYVSMLTESDLPDSDVNPNYLKLNEYLDLQVLTSPNATMRNWVYFGQTYDVLGIAKGYRTYGITGTLRLKLRKDMIGGAVLIPRDQLVANVYRSMQRSPNPAAQLTKNRLPAFNITLKGQTLPVPVECSIQANNQSAYLVEFGDLNSADITLDGSRYGKEIQLDYRCNSERSIPVKVQMVSDNSVFSSNFVTTSNPEIGIVVKQGGKTVKPWGSFDSVLLNGRGSDRIYVAPVKNPAAKTIPTGDFTGNAVLGCVP